MHNPCIAKYLPPSPGGRVLKLVVPSHSRVHHQRRARGLPHHLHPPEEEEQGRVGKPLNFNFSGASFGAKKLAAFVRLFSIKRTKNILDLLNVFTCWPFRSTKGIFRFFSVTAFHNFIPFSIAGNRVCWIEWRIPPTDSEMQQRDFPVKYPPQWPCTRIAPPKLKTLSNLTVMNPIMRSFYSPTEMMSSLR